MAHANSSLLAMEPFDRFAADLTRLRNEKKLIQGRLPEQVGPGLSDIAKIEPLRRDPWVKVVAKIAYGLARPRGRDRTVG